MSKNQTFLVRFYVNQNKITGDKYDELKKEVVPSKIIFIHGYFPKKPSAYSGQLPRHLEVWRVEVVHDSQPDNLNKGYYRVKLVNNITEIWEQQMLDKQQVDRDRLVVLLVRDRTLEYARMVEALIDELLIYRSNSYLLRAFNHLPSPSPQEALAGWLGLDKWQLLSISEKFHFICSTCPDEWRADIVAWLLHLQSIREGNVAIFTDIGQRHFQCRLCGVSTRMGIANYRSYNLGYPVRISCGNCGASEEF